MYVPFEEQLDNEIKHDRFRILVYNGANLVHAKVGYMEIRDWSLITGRGGGGGLKHLKIGGPKLFSPASRQGKTFRAIPPF